MWSRQTELAPSPGARSDARHVARNSVLSDWLRFNAVGLVGVVVQLSLLALFRSGLGWSVTWATAVAVECSVVHNFVWHECWTWAYRNLETQGLVGRLLRFNISNGLISLLGNLALMELLAVRMHLNYMAANLVAILLCSLVNFFASDRLVFRRSGE